MYKKHLSSHPTLPHTLFLSLCIIFSVEYDESVKYVSTINNLFKKVVSIFVLFLYVSLYIYMLRFQNKICCDPIGYGVIFLTQTQVNLDLIPYLEKYLFYFISQSLINFAIFFKNIYTLNYCP